jgi:hypothetical protein
LSGSPRIGSNHCRQRERLPRCRLHRLRIHQAVSSNPHFVIRLRQIRNQIAAAIVGNDNFSKLRWQIGSLSNHPYASLGTFRTGHRASDVVSTDGDAARIGLRCGNARRQRLCPDDRENYKATQKQNHQQPSYCDVLHNVFSPGVLREIGFNRLAARPLHTLKQAYITPANNHRTFSLCMTPASRRHISTQIESVADSPRCSGWIRSCPPTHSIPAY